MKDGNSRVIKKDAAAQKTPEETILGNKSGGWWEVHSSLASSLIDCIAVFGVLENEIPQTLVINQSDTGFGPALA
jgi:hypothetical protein